MEILYIINSGIHQVLHFTNDIPAVRVSLGVYLCQNESFIVSVRCIVDALPLFIHYNILLICECSLCNCIP